jgi:ABC-2 type transport system permease protein
VSALAYRIGIRPSSRFFVVVGTLAVAQFRLRYLDSALSFLWAIARPAFFFAVMWIVFTQVAHVNHGVPHYGPYLFAAIVLWSFFAESTATATTSLLVNGHLLRKIPLPPLAIPMATALSSVFDLAMSLGAVLVLVLAAGIDPRLTWLELPLLVGALAFLVSGVGMLLSVWYVRFRDVDQLWIVGRQALFYLTPIFYVLASVPSRAQDLVMMNPLTVIFTQMRYVLIDPNAPNAATAAGGYVHLLPALAITIGLFVAGLVAFARANPWLAERL